MSVLTALALVAAIPLAVSLGPSATVASPLTPAAGVILAWADARGLPVDLARNVRYLWRWQEPQTKLVEWTQALNGHVQGLSTGLRAVPPYEVPGSGGRLLRVDLRDYHWDPEVWERLADVDPYFHATVIQEKDRVFEQEYGYWRYDSGYQGGRRWFTTRTEDIHRKSRVKVHALAPWLTETPEGREAVAGLVRVTGSQVPIVSSEWFVNQTAINFGRQAGYYSWLGIRDRDDFNALVGFNPKVVARAKRKALLEAVARSRVSKRPRRIAAFPALGGNTYYTFDNVDALDKTNPLRVLDDRNFEHAAEEAFGPLPNGWIAWGLFVGPNPADKALKDGQTQDSAPDFIGYSHLATDNDGKIHVGLSCWQCHANEGDGGKAGIMDVKEWARTLYQPPFGLQSYSPDVARDLADKYLRDLQGPINDDRAKWGRVIVQTTGMPPAKWAKVYSEYWAAYESKGIDLATVEIDLGMSRAEFLPGWEKVAATGNLDPVLAALLAAARRGDKGVVIERQQWEEVFSLAEYAARGYVTPPDSGDHRP